MRRIMVVTVTFVMTSVMALSALPVIAVNLIWRGRELSTVKPSARKVPPSPIESASLPAAADQEP